jgi:predicted nucleic acid-binding protein
MSGLSEAGIEIKDVYGKFGDSVQAALFDTLIYVAALRSGDDGALAIRQLNSGSVVWLSSVVLEELYAGAGDRGRPVVERLERDFDRAKRVLVPNLNDWTEAGRVLSRLAAKYDFEQIGRGRLANDALIAMSAGRQGIKVVTTNERDFRRLAEFRSFQWQVTAV